MGVTGASSSSSPLEEEPELCESVEEVSEGMREVETDDPECEDCEEEAEAARLRAGKFGLGLGFALLDLPSEDEGEDVHEIRGEECVEDGEHELEGEDVVGEQDGLVPSRDSGVSVTASCAKSLSTLGVRSSLLFLRRNDAWGLFPTLPVAGSFFPLGVRVLCEDAGWSSDDDSGIEASPFEVGASRVLEVAEERREEEWIEDEEVRCW